MAVRVGSAAGAVSGVTADGVPVDQEYRADLAAGGGPALDLVRKETRVPLQAANICASVNGAGMAEQAVAALSQRKGAL